MLYSSHTDWRIIMRNDKLEAILNKVQKPARYTGGEVNSIIKDKSEIDCRFAFCFPDTYEIGMSHIGMKILYSVLNEQKNIWCERVFAPWIDFEQELRENNIPLYALESLDPIKDFDIIGFTLQYELCYTNVLNMLELAGVELLSKDRDELSPLVVAGGPCTCNPEPISDFIDLFMIGEGEYVIVELCNEYIKAKKEGLSKKEFLKRAAQIDGIYVPSLYDVDYNTDGTIKSITAKDNAPNTVRKLVIEDMDKVLYPDKFVVPFIDIVHNRAVLEVMRGCIRGCRFCQAGFIYRPLREKDCKVLCEQAKALCESTGYEEISLASLSTSDYSEIEPFLEELVQYTDKNRINLSLPSLRIDNFNEDLMKKISAVRKSGLTFAPEAGTQRLRDVINKNVCEDDIFKSCTIAFEGGYSNVKLYFMLGLPTETNEDLEGIIDLAQRIVNLYYNLENRKKGRPVNVTVSVSTFVPKPFTPFQWEPQATMDEIIEKQKHLMSCITSKKITCNRHEVKTSVLEGVFSRGDRRLGEVLLNAHKKGCKFDSWSEMFDFDKWTKALEECNLTIHEYANRKRSYDEILPWDHIEHGVTKEFLVRESKKANEGVTTPNCREKCSGCGANTYSSGRTVCTEKRGGHA